MDRVQKSDGRPAPDAPAQPGGRVDSTDDIDPAITGELRKNAAALDELGVDVSRTERGRPVTAAVRGASTSSRSAAGQAGWYRGSPEQEGRPRRKHRNLLE